MIQNQLHCMEWPEHGPDLNIIENKWRKTKLQLQEQAYNSTTKTHIETAIRNIWTNIPLTSTMIRDPDGEAIDKGKRKHPKC